MPARKIFSALLCVLFLWGIAFISNSFIFAVSTVEITSYKSSIAKFEEFEVEFNVSLEANTQYYYKGRIGQGSSRNKAETYNSDKQEWLGDTKSWTTFSSFQTNSAGNFNENVKIKVKEEANEGENKLTIRVHKINPSKNIDSDEVNINIIGSLPSETDPSSSPSPSPSPYPPNLPNQPYPSNVFLSEFMACPSEGNEWVEIYSDNDSSVNLSDWLIRDSTDGKNQSFSADIGGKSYHKIDISGYLLNNSGDSVRLLNPGSEVDSHSYSECDSSYTWSKVNGNWCKTDQSPGNNNNSCKEESSQDSNSSPSPSSTTPQSSAKPSTKPSSSPKTIIKSNKNTKPSSSPDQSEIKLMEYADVLGEQDENKEEEEENKSLFQSKLFFPIILSLSGLLFITASLYPKIRPKILKILGKK